MEAWHFEPEGKGIDWPLLRAGSLYPSLEVGNRRSLILQKKMSFLEEGYYPLTFGETHLAFLDLCISAP